MVWQPTPYLLPLIVASITSVCWVTLHWFRYRHLPSARIVVILILGTATWTLADGLQLAAVDLASKLLWIKIQVLGGVWISAAWFAFAILFTRRSSWFKGVRWLLLAVFPLILIGLEFSDLTLPLILRDSSLVRIGSTIYLNGTYGPALILFSLYAFVLQLAATGMLLQLVFRSKPFHWRYVTLVVVGFTFLLALYVIDVLNLLPILQPRLLPLVMLVIIPVSANMFSHVRRADLAAAARKLLVTTLPDPVIVIDADQMVLDYNPAAQAVFNGTLHDIIGSPVSQLSEPLAELITHMTMSSDNRIELVLTNDHLPKVYDVRATNMIDQHRHIMGQMLVLRDITARKKGEEASQAFLADMKALQKLYLELSREDDEQTLLKRMVELGQTWLGLERLAVFLPDPTTQQLVGTYGVDSAGHIRDEHYYHEPLTPDHWSLEILNNFQHVKLWNTADLLDNGEPVGSGWKIGAALWDGHQALGYLMTDNFVSHRAPRSYETEFISLLGSTFGHLLRLKQTTAQLRQSEERLQFLIKNSLDSILLRGKNGRILAANPAACQMSGYSEEELRSLKPRDLMDGADPRSLSAMKEREHNASMRTELTSIRRDGSRFPIELTVADFTDSQGEILTWAIARDLSEQKRYEQTRIEQEKLQTALAKEAELSALKSRMMQRMAHEFRTPLAIIQAKSETLSVYGERLTPEQRTTKVTEIQQSIERLTEMLDEMNLTINGQFVQADLKFVSLDMNAMCRSVAAELEARLGLRGKFELDLCPLAMVNGDYLALHRAVRHIMGNAARFSAPTEGVKVQSTSSDLGVELHIIDRGIGIPPEEQTRLFEPFFRGSNIGEIGGLGLGLAIAQAALEAHQGKIHIESVLHQGTTVRIWLPKAAV